MMTISMEVKLSSGWSRLLFPTKDDGHSCRESCVGKRPSLALVLPKRDTWLCLIARYTQCTAMEQAHFRAVVCLF